MSSVNAGADKPTDGSLQSATSRPTRPDDEAYKVGLAEREAAVDKSRKKQADAQQRFNDRKTARSTNDNPKYKELRDQLDQVKQQQASSRSSRQQEMDRIKTLDTQLKAKLNEQKASKQQIPFKSTDEIESEIQRLEKSVESGKLKMVDERKTVNDISALRRQKKAFGGIDERQRDIDRLKDSIADIKKSTDKAEHRQQQREFDRIKTELDEFHLARKDASKDADTAFEALKQARAESDKAYADLRRYKDAHYMAKQEYREYEREANKVREAKRKAEREAYLRSRKQEALERRLEEASMPAYGEEIRAAESIMRVVDPSSVPTTTSSTVSELAAKASRVVDATGIKGTVLSKKDDDESYFVGGAGKKGKKGRKVKDAGSESSSLAPAAKDTLGKLWAPGSIEQFSKIGIEPPAAADDIPGVLEKAKTKREFYLGDRDRKTKENVDNAQKEFDALESDEGRASSSAANQKDISTPKGSATDAVKGGESSHSFVV
ncbi:MAG: hypothetical protein Q9159_003225 [Coniocarpon cinnabarinum]